MLQRSGLVRHLNDAPLIALEADVRELRDHLRRYLDLVRDGEEITMTDQGKAIARLVPLIQPSPLDRLIAEGLVTAALTPNSRAPVPPSRLTGR
jgi:antitoxin (DNA-binding transcriptional repressor) of toxin-antitoxin stability system